MAPHLAEERELLSALIDGESDAPEAAGMLTALRSRSQLSDDWGVYHCIGDVLRSDDMGCHSAVLANKLAAQLALEPHHLVVPMVSANAYSSRWRRPASLAAAAAAVVAVAWALPQLRFAQEQIAAAPAGAPAAVVASSAPPPAPRVASGYVEAHRQYSSSVAAYHGGGVVQSVTFDSGR